MDIGKIPGKLSSFTGITIEVDANAHVIRFCSADKGGDFAVTSLASFGFTSYDEKFFRELAEISLRKIKELGIASPRISLILPDGLFLLDTVSVPVIHRKAMQQSLTLAIEALYNNVPDLSIKHYTARQSKDTATFGLIGIRREILDFANNAFNGVGLPISRITYAASAMTSGAMALNGKLKGDTFLLVDIKSGVTRFALVVRGCTMGYYELPFGNETLQRTRVVSEDTLFDNRAGNLLVLNSIERAHAKRLTDTDEFLDGGECADTDISADEAARGKEKLRQFIQHPAPEGEEECVYENFRIFLKWSLELINNNPDILSLANLDTVYINMPEEYGFLFDMVKRNNTESGLAFLPLLSDGTDSVIAESLELYGGFFADRFNEANSF